MQDGKSSEALWVISPQRHLENTTLQIVDDIIDKYFVKEKLITVEQDEQKCGA